MATGASRLNPQRPQPRTLTMTVHKAIHQASTDGDKTYRTSYRGCFNGPGFHASERRCDLTQALKECFLSILLFTSRDARALGLEDSTE